MNDMKWIADFHLHSKYSGGTSPRMEPAQIAAWAAKKKLNLLGTGDFTHPVYLAELKKSWSSPSRGSSV